jgi:hypothetical protein
MPTVSSQATCSSRGGMSNRINLDESQRLPRAARVERRISQETVVGRGVVGEESAGFIAGTRDGACQW